MEPGLNFEHAALEQDIEKLASQVKEKATIADYKDHKEAVEEALREKTGVPKVTQLNTSQAGESSSAVLPNYLNAAEPDVKLKVGKLVDLAWHKGLSAAIKEAQQEGPLYVDALHDVLTDKLYEEFKKRKLL